MYLLFRYHHILPGAYYAMGPGEQTVARAFLRYEMETRAAEIEELESMWR